MAKDIRETERLRKIFCNCFVCSKTNPQGLHLDVDFADGKSHAEFVPYQHMEGLAGLMHGGFSMMLMDEVMYYAIESHGINPVSLNINIDFISPAILTHRMCAEGNVEKIDGKKVYTTGRLFDMETGKDIVTAKALYYEVDMTQFLPNGLAE